MWQDYCLTATAFLFSYSLIPQIIKLHKLKKCNEISSNFILVNLFAVAVSCICTYSMKLYITGTSNVIQFVLWLIIYIQKVKYED